VDDLGGISNKPFVSIVIPHRGHDANLEICLRAIRNQTYPRESIEVLIVLNEPVNRSLSFELIPGDKLLWQPITGSYAARNLGIENSSGEIVALTDSDTVPNPDWISAGVSSFTHDVQLVAGAIDVTHSNPPTASELFEKLYAFDQEKNVKFGHSVTANLLVKTEVFHTYGLFDQTARSGEDFEWTRSVTRRGAVIVYCAEAVVTHPARATLSDLFKKAFRTAWYFPKGASGADTSVRLLRRVRQKLFFGPTPSRRLNMTLSQRLIARLIRISLFGFQGVLLLVRPIKSLGKN
jgi:cellulose synthase/poly-beta-1,6-N-acetylglucosamine synthase-like glycosyltransferase